MIPKRGFFQTLGWKADLYLARKRKEREERRRAGVVLFGEPRRYIREAARPTGDAQMPETGPKAPGSGSRKKS